MFGSKTDGIFSFDDAAKQASTAGKWRDHVFKLSGSSSNWDDLWDAMGEKSLIEMLLHSSGGPAATSRLIWVGKDSSSDFSLVSLALAEVHSWVGGGDAPSASNPVVILVKPGEYEDYMELQDNYVHIFGIGNQAESVIIKNDAHHIVTVSHPAAAVLGFNILKGLELYQYGTDSIQNVLFDTPPGVGVTALMCRECYFKRDVSGATTVDSDAMFKVQHGIFFGEDIRVEMNITDASAATTRYPRMFYMGNGSLAGLMIRDAKIDYTTIDIDDENTLVLTHDDFVGEVSITESDINISNEADTGTAAGVFNLVKSGAAASFRFDHSTVAMSDNGGKESDFYAFKMSNAGAQVFSGYNTYNCNMARGGSATIFSGNGDGTTRFDFLSGCEMGSLDTLQGAYYLNGYGFFHIVQDSSPDSDAPENAWQYWFASATGDLWGQTKFSGDGLVYDRKLTYEDWAHLPVAAPLDATYPTYRLYIPDSVYQHERNVFVPGRPVYCEASGTICHGIVTAASAVSSHWQVDIAGYIPQLVNGYDQSSWHSGDFSRVVVERFTIPGLFSYQASNALLADYLGQYYIWRRGHARIVQISHRVVNIDTGNAQPRVNVSVDGNKVCTANTNNGRDISASWVHTVDDINGPFNGGNNYNRLSFGSVLEITVDNNGQYKDGSDLTVEITIVLE